MILHDVRGVPVAMSAKDIERFESKIFANPTSGCYEWIGSLSSTGYGKIKIGPVTFGSHRVAFEMAHPLLPSECVLHRCDNRKCCRPEHLFLGDRADNVADMFSKGRDRHVEGEAQHLSKLTTEAVAYIRASAEKPGDLAVKYGVHPNTIMCVVRGHTWKGTYEKRRAAR